MFKKIVMVFVLFFAMESFSYGAQLSPEQARQSLQQANITFMNLMLGSEGIRTIKSTPEECRQMIDGCLTAGITDRLYGFPDQSLALRAMADQLDGIKKNHALLAIEFYAVGYLNMHDNSNRNVPAEFNKLCQLVFPRGTIFVYKDRLEDEIKRASQPLRYGHFGIGVAPAVAPSVAASALPTPPPVVNDSSSVAAPEVEALPRLPGGHLAGIARGLGGLKKNGASSQAVASPPPPAAVAVTSPPEGHLSAILGGLASLKNVDSFSPVVAAAAPPLPVDEAEPSPPPAAVDAAPPRANLGLFSGSEHLLKRAEDLQKPKDHDPDSDDDQEVWK